jgi:hypothetical protein
VQQATVSALIEREIAAIGREIACLEVAIERHQRMIASPHRAITLHSLLKRRARSFGQLGGAYRASIDARAAGR